MTDAWSHVWDTKLEINSLLNQKPRLGALCILQRPTGEVCWAKRGDTAPFLGGYWTFPGGLLNEEDIRWAQDHLMDELNDPEQLTNLEHKQNWRTHIKQLALKHTAFREAREEVGVLWEDEEENALQETLKEGIEWETHPYIPHSMRVSFFWRPQFLGTLSVLRDHEMNQVEWIYPREALERWASGEATLAPPTYAILSALATNAPPSQARALFPELHDINQVRPLISLLPLKTPTLPPATHTNTYLIGREHLTLVDPASPYPQEQERLEQLLDDHIARGGTLERIILTHHHHDHIGGVNRLKERYQIPVWAHSLNHSLLPFKIDHEVFDGEQVIIGEECETPEMTLTALHTPGHAVGHLCLIDSDTQTAIVGDMVASVGTILIDFEEGDMREYLKQLERLKDLNLKSLLPSHGTPIANVEELLSHYIQHRLAREEKIWAALQSTHWSTLGEIVECAYAEAPLMVRSGTYGGLAGRSALAHLIKLAQDQRVVCSDQLFALKSLWRQNPS